MRIVTGYLLRQNDINYDDNDSPYTDELDVMVPLSKNQIYLLGSIVVRN